MENYMSSNTSRRTSAVYGGEHVRGWKVYVDGEKFPKKPMDFYQGMTEEQAITKALEKFRGKSTKSLQARRMAIVREMSTIVGGGGGGKL
jgi:hypothetical protein